ncbi:hypothetical protein FHR85_002324 [Alkalibacillus almallahensis]|nr:hypothetical protein [Alkalibacillus almallahensis]
MRKWIIIAIWTFLGIFVVLSAIAIATYYAF